MILDAVDKRALQDQVSFGLTLVVHLGCSGSLMFVHRVYIKFVFKNGPLTFWILLWIRGYGRQFSQFCT